MGTGPLMLSVIDAVVPSTLNNWTFCPSISGENTSIGAKLTSARFNRKKNSSNCLIVIKNYESSLEKIETTKYLIMKKKIRLQNPIFTVQIELKKKTEKEM